MEMPNLDAQEVSNQAHDWARMVVNDIVDTASKAKLEESTTDVMLHYGDVYNALVRIYAVGYRDALDTVGKILDSTPDVTKAP